MTMTARGTLQIGSIAGAVALATLFGLGEAIAQKAETAAPKKSFYESQSLYGSYLAGRYARTKRDAAAAAHYYGRALQFDPDNEVLVRQAFLTEAANGNWPAVSVLAKRLVKFEPSHRLARLYLGVEYFQDGKFDESVDNFGRADSGPISELTATLAQSWTKLAAGQPNDALATIDGMKKADWVVFYQSYHRALIAVLAERPKTAEAAFKRIFKQEPRTLRVALAYARFLASQNKTTQARRVLRKHLAATKSRHPMAEALLANIGSAESKTPLVKTAEEGLAEVLYGLGEAWTHEGGLDIGQIYLRFALKARPDFELANEALAHVYEKTKRYERAIEAYENIAPDHPIGLDAGIQRALNLNLLERVDEAKAVLDQLVAKNPKNIRPVAALGNVMRWNKRYDDAISYFSDAIKLSGKLERSDWTYFYSRGIAYDQVKNWPAAEKDFKQALKLNPDQPQTLNYLGYSWVDRNLNLTRALGMIRKAVKLKPDDGYIVDSLGWAHYKLGNWKKAVRYLERAVELKPDDPVINDHFGDALWRVGRRREARYQWEISLTLKPKPEDEKVTKKKLLAGLPDAVKPKKPVVKKRRVKEKRADVTQQEPFQPFAQ